jgi:hypothetical protein
LNKWTIFAILLILIIIGSTLAVYGASIAQEAANDKNYATDTLNGDLTSFKINSEEPIYLLIGTRVPFHFTAKELSDGINLSNFITSTFENTTNLTNDNFRITSQDGKLEVSASIRDSAGNLIARVVNNTWKTVDPSYQLEYWDRNYNSYAFEVIDSNYLPILQVAIIGPNEIQVGGLFYTETGFVRVAPSLNGGATISYYPKGMTIDEADKNETVPLLFKYPALTNSSNLGKMENRLYPSTDPLADINGKSDLGFALQVIGSLIVTVSSAVISIDWIIERRIKKSNETQIPPTNATNDSAITPYWKLKQRKNGHKKKEKD